MIDAISLYSICISAFRVILREIIVVHITYLSLLVEILKFLMSSTVSVSWILIGESSQRAIVFTVELPRGRALSPTFMNPDIITGLVYVHMTVEPMAVQNWMKRTLC